MRTTLHKLILIFALAGGMSMARSAPIETPAPGSITVNASGIVYYARAGDTLLGIAQRLTTATANWEALGRINHIRQDIRIPIGTGIVIPTELLPDEPSDATVIARNGNVTVTGSDGHPLAVDVGTKVAEGARIDTAADSFLTLQLPDASRISIPSNSEVELAKLRKARYTHAPRTELKLLQGKVVSRVSPLNVNKGTYEVHTPLSVAGVRGTYFRVGMNAGKVTDEVLEGHVLVGSPQAPHALMLNPATGDVIRAAEVGPSIDLLPAPALAAQPYREDGSARFFLAPVKGARAYHVQLARDADMVDLIAEATGDSPDIHVGHIAEGDYFASVSAIDRSGLEGLPHVFAVRIEDRDDAALAAIGPAPSVVRSDAKEMVLRWNGAPDREYNVQVARNLDFSWLLFSKTVTGNEARFPRPSFGTYFARVQSVNPDGSTMPFSFAQTLIVTDQWIINDGRPVRPREELSSSTYR